MQILLILTTLQWVEIHQKLVVICTDATLSTEGLSATLVYVDGTQGWLVVNDFTIYKHLLMQFI
jgi:hypothetical protein